MTKTRLFKEGDKVNISGDISNSDYNVRVSSSGVVDADQSTANSKVWVTIDEIDGDRNVSMRVSPKMLTLVESKSEANLADLKGLVVSEGTMGVNALIRKYLAVLETYAPDNYKAYIEANPELKDREVWMALDVEDKSYIVDELADELDKIAPEGYYFGASEGDGACYGFWEVEPDESKKPEACKGGKDDDTKVGKDGKATESKKSEGIDGAIKMNIDYNTFMRLLDAAAYLDADDDYKDALWDYYSEFGEIDGDADVFFDNLFQYTAWYDVDEMYDAIGERFQDESKSKEECIQDAIDDVDMTICPYNDHYLVIF